MAPGVPVLLGDIPMDAKAGEGVTWRCQEEDLTAMNELLLGNDWLTWRKNYKQWRMGQGSGARGEAASGARKKAQESDRLGGLRRKTWTIGEAEEAARSQASARRGARSPEMARRTERIGLMPMRRGTACCVRSLKKTNTAGSWCADVSVPGMSAYAYDTGDGDKAASLTACQPASLPACLPALLSGNLVVSHLPSRPRMTQTRWTRKSPRKSSPSRRRSSALASEQVQVTAVSQRLQGARDCCKEGLDRVSWLDRLG